MTSYEIPEYLEMHDALRKHDITHYLDAADMLDNRIDAIACNLYDLASTYGCVMVDVNGLGVNDNAYTRQEVRQYLHRSARYPGCLQLTTWDCYGPVCDVRISDAAELATELRHNVRSKMWCMYDAA
jgi:hypothetical protein